jgi:hypothetical protein
MERAYRRNPKASETNPLRFLRYFVLSHFDTKTAKPLPEVELYNWISKNAELVGLEKAPSKFLKELINDAKVYRNISNALDPSGRPNRYLKNIQVLSGRAAKQHFILLLAGQKLESSLFDRLCQVLENLFFCFIVTKEATKSFEAVFYRVAASLRKLSPGDSNGLEAFIQEWLQPEIDRRANKLQFTLENLSSNGLQKYRLRYVLAKLTQYVDEKAWSTNTELEKYLDKRVHIEHILPDKSTPDLLNAFDRPEAYGSYSARLGNLTLLEMSINTSIGQNFFKEKNEDYQKSNFVLTKTIGAPFQVGVDTQPNRATAELQSWNIWNSATIEERQQMLIQLAWRVWGVSAGLVKR